MLTVSQGFKDSIKQLSVFSDGYLEVVNANGTLTYDSSDISKFEIFGTAFNNDTILGNIAQHTLTIELLGDFTKDIPLNMESVVKVYLGVKVDSLYEYVQFQDFLITEIIYSDTTNVTRIIGTDYLIKLNTEFVDTNTYPMTSKAYTESVLTACGLQLENSTFLNDSFSVTSQPFINGTLARDIIKQVAEMAMSFAIINKVSGKVELREAFSPFTRGYTHEELEVFTHELLEDYTHYELEHAINLEDEEIKKSHYWSLKLSDHWFGQYGINTLTLKVSDIEGENVSKSDSEYILTDGVNEISIIDNQFINTEAKRQSVIDSMFTEIVGYKYYPYSLEYRGFPYLEIGDVVDILKMDNGTLDSPIYEMTIRYDGGIYGKIGAEALSKTNTLYRNTKPLSQRVKTAEIKVDKVEGEVTIMAGDYYDGKLVGTYYNFDGDAFTITNADSEVVFSADSLGNLTLTGTITSGDGDFVLDTTNKRLYIGDSYITSVNYTTGTSIATYQDTFNMFPLTTDVSGNKLVQVQFGYFNAILINSYTNSTSSWVSQLNIDTIISSTNIRANGGMEIKLGGVLYSVARDANGFLKAV